MMAKIAQAAEEEFPFDQFLRRELAEKADLPQAISHAASFLAEEVRAVAIVTPTESGSTATMGFETSAPATDSRFEPPSLHSQKAQSLLGGHPVLVSDWKDTDDMLERSKRMPKELGMASTGDRVVIIAGVPISIPGTTNLIKVETVE